MKATRPMVVAEARTWKGTPYHRHAMIKGAGVDCGLLPYAIYRHFDLIPAFEVEFLSDDWFCNTTQEKYLRMVQVHLKKLLEGQARRDLQALPGSLVVARVAVGKLYNHSGIVTRWPYVVHAVHSGVDEVDASNDPLWICKPVEVFDPWDGAL